MRKLIILILLTICKLVAEAQHKESTTNFDHNWQFIKDIDTTTKIVLLSKSSIINEKWESISLPHTPNIEPIQKIKEQWQGTCFYRKFFRLSISDKRKHIAIRFDGAMHDCDVYLNGIHIYKHIGGYLPFYINITPYVFSGKANCLLVKLNNQDNSAIPPGKPIKDLDFNYYGGLYRHVWMIKTKKLYISDAIAASKEAGGGILSYTNSINNNSASIFIKVNVNNDYDTKKPVKLKMMLIDTANRLVASGMTGLTLVPPSSSSNFRQNLKVNNPELWSTEHPYLYQLKVEVVTGRHVIDQQTVCIGLKSIQFNADGFYLNGKKVVIRGTNRHQEYPYIGYALSDNAQFRDARKIKSAGFNFVRCSHYPPSSAFLDACDQLGILVMDAIPGWQYFGNEQFQRNSFQNIRDMIRRDRNHPSVVLWEASLNETNMNKSYMDSAYKIVHLEMPFKNVYATGWIDYAYDVFNPARQHLKAPDYWKKYNKDKPLLLAEYGDWEYYAQNAGFNQTEYQNLTKSEKSSRQMRSYGAERMLQQALNFQEAHNDNLNGRIVGDVNWLMFDYKRGYAADLETSGIMDIFRLPKFSYYFFQSQIDLAQGKPMLFIANNWNEECNKKVKIFSNCDQVELFVNGVSLGKQLPDTGATCSNLNHPPFTFQPASFVPGVLTAIGYVKGKKIIKSIAYTPSKASKIILEPDLNGKELVADKNDAIFVYAKIMDNNGAIIPDAENLVTFSITGDGKIIGPAKVKAEAGIATFLLMAGSRPGKITISATAANLNKGIVTLSSLKSD